MFGHGWCGQPARCAGRSRVRAVGGAEVNDEGRQVGLTDRIEQPPLSCPIVRHDVFPAGTPLLEYYAPPPVPSSGKGEGLSVGYGGSAAAHRWQLPAPRRAPRQRRLLCAQGGFAPSPWSAPLPRVSGRVWKGMEPSQGVWKPHMTHYLCPSGRQKMCGFHTPSLEPFHYPSTLPHLALKRPSADTSDSRPGAACAPNPPCVVPR